MTKPAPIFLAHEHDVFQVNLEPKNKQVEAMSDFIEFNYKDTVFNDEIAIRMPINYNLFVRFYKAFLFFQEMVSKSSGCEKVDLREAVKAYNIPGTSMTLDEQVNPNDDVFEISFSDEKTQYSTTFFAINAAHVDELEIDGEDLCCACPVKESFHKVFRNNIESEDLSIKKIKQTKAD